MKRALLAMACSVLIMLAPPLRAQEKPDLEGHWLGTLAVSALELRIVINLKAADSGGYSGTMDSIDQGAKGIPISNVTLEARKFAFAMPAIQGKFEGAVSEDANVIDGTWTQAGVAIPLKLVRKSEADLPANHRPQEPKSPFPYQAIEVAYANEEAEGVSLAGTLTLPEGDGPFPAAILISGSGPQNRDEELLGHKPFLIIADHLTRRGVAVLRCDDRGIAQSKGDFAKATTEDFASDAAAGVKFLKARGDIRSDRIGLIGHSEGGVIAPMAAAKSEDVAFIVLMAGTGVNGAEVISLQAEAIARAMGSSDAEVEEAKRVQREIASLLDSDDDEAAARRKVEAALRKSIESLPAGQREKMGDSGAFVNQQADQLMSPWFRFFLRYDPKTALRKVKCPVLAINGERDLQVIPSQNLPAIAAALEEGGNSDYTIVKFPGLNHLFQHCTTGAPAEYAKIEETISPEVLETMGDWILKRFPAAGR